MEQRFADGIRLSFDMQARLMGKVRYTQGTP